MSTLTLRGLGLWAKRRAGHIVGTVVVVGLLATLWVWWGTALYAVNDGGSLEGKFWPAFLMSGMLAAAATLVLVSFGGLGLFSLWVFVLADPWENRFAPFLRRHRPRGKKSRAALRSELQEAAKAASAERALALTAAEGDFLRATEALLDTIGMNPLASPMGARDLLLEAYSLAHEPLESSAS